MLPVTSLTPLRFTGMFSSVGEVCEGFTGVGGYELDDQERFGTQSCCWLWWRWGEREAFRQL